MKIQSKITSLARAAFVASITLTLLGTYSASAAKLGVWEYDGYTNEEEGEGSAGWSASVTINHGGEEVMLTLGCGIPGKQFGLSLIGQEKFTTTAQKAVKAAKGKIEPDESYLDVQIDDQIFQMKSMVADYDGSLQFLDDFTPNGPIANAFVRGESAKLTAPGLQLKIPLKNSSNAICKTFKKCGAKQTYCASTGR